jgi:predicted DsbA family dithiol-disulfide isomerase
VWRAFELRPEPVPTLDPDGEYLHRVWGSSVYPMAERLGMTLRLPPVQPRSRRAHEAAHWSRTQGQFDHYNAAVFRAFFERGEDIGKIDVLAKLAEDLALGAESLRNALEAGEFEQSALADQRAAQALGVRGVPAFVANRTAALSGVQTVEGLCELVGHVRK